MGLVIHDRERKVQPILPIYKVSYRNRKPYASLVQRLEPRTHHNPNIFGSIPRRGKHANSMDDTDIGVGSKIDMWL